MGGTTYIAPLFNSERISSRKTQVDRPCAWECIMLANRGGAATNYSLYPLQVIRNTQGEVASVERERHERRATAEISVSKCPLPACFGHGSWELEELGAPG